MTKYSLALAVLLAGLSFSAQAEEQSSGETKAKVQDVSPDALEKEGDIDELITNRKLRAETGSKSKYSISSSWNYAGANLGSPLSKDRPNITGSSATRSVPRLTGGVGVKYRATQKDSFSLGVDLGITEPFHTPYGKTKANKLEFNEPDLGYTHLNKLGDVQSVSSLNLTMYTSEFLRNIGYQAALGASQIFLYDVGASGLSVGVLLGAGVYQFDKENQIVTELANKNNPAGQPANVAQSDHYVGAYPMLEYVINDKLNFRTISGVWVYEHARTAEVGTYTKNLIYQSIGLGISVTRDIYLYPNVQILPENVRADLTNWALAANINVF